jgi:hypothetical protein
MDEQAPSTDVGRPSPQVTTAELIPLVLIGLTKARRTDAVAILPAGSPRASSFKA